MRVSLHHTCFLFPISVLGGGARRAVGCGSVRVSLGLSVWPVAVRVLEASSWLRLCVQTNTTPYKGLDPCCL